MANGKTDNKEGVETGGTTCDAAGKENSEQMLQDFDC